MKYRCACLGLEGILENEAFAEFILQDIRYTIPGFGSDYELCTFDHGVEFTQCYKGNVNGAKPVGMAMHFSSFSRWTVAFDSVIDNKSVAHEYYVSPVDDASRRFPLRLICPDVLAETQHGDELYGQVAAFIENGKIIKGDSEVDNTVVAEDDHAVRIAGRISQIQTHTFEFEDIKREYLELDIETDLGMISGVVLQSNLDAIPEEDDSIIARAYVSLDVAMPHESRRSRAFYEKPNYPPLPGSREDCDYQCGYIRSQQNAMRILAQAIHSEGAFRFGRCCADEVQFVDASGLSHTLNRWAVVDKISALLADAQTAEVVLSVAEKSGTNCLQDGILIDECEYLVVETDEDGQVNKITQLSAEHYEHDNDPDRYLLGILANAMCNGAIEKLRSVMSAECAYRSDYSGKKEYGIRNVIESISGVYKNLDETNGYHYELVPAFEEIIESEREDLPGIFTGNWCCRLYQGKKLAAVIFLRYDANKKITSILLSRKSSYLKSFAQDSSSKVEEKDFEPVDTLLRRRFGSENTIRNMRCEDIDMVDEGGAYVWQKADEYIQDWFRDNSYRLNSTELFDDCIGYACTRRGVEYAVYVYAYGKRKTSMLDGDYCAKLRDHNLSKDRTILVIYLHVTAEEDDEGETTFFVGQYNSKDDAPQVWKLGWIGDRSVMLFFPRKEMDDLGRRFEAAYNAQRLDIMKTLFSSDISLTGMGSGTTMNAGLYNSLAYHHKNHGMMKTGYIRFNDVVYSEISYIEDYCYVHFTVNKQDQIDKIIFEPLDENYRELVMTGESLMSHPMDDVPALEKVEFLPASELSRFSMLLWYVNGETRRYDAPGDFGNDDVVTWLGCTFTDKMFRNGRISDSVYSERDWLRRNYPDPHPGVEFINGAGIFAVELYHKSYPVGEFIYRDGMEIFIKQENDDNEPCAVGYIHDLDPSNPVYLLDKKQKIAKTIPAKYQKTPVFCYPFCGGYSEGLVMVSTMGDMDLRYHHNRSSCAGVWGWLDSDLKTVIEPKYVYAMNFCNGRAIVCKGEWTTTEQDGKLQYWCGNERWGVIDQQEREIVPCQFDELYEVEGTDRLYFVHESMYWSGVEGSFARIEEYYAIYDVQEQEVILKLDFNFDMGYMFNRCFVAEGDILVFMDHLPGKGEDLIYAYDLHNKKFIAYAESYTERTLNGESKVVVNKDGQEIIVF